MPFKKWNPSQTTCQNKNNADLIDTNFRSLKAALDNWFYGVINVRDVGAKGDGIQDDYLYIQQAVNEALANGKAIYFPTGNYLISSQISGTATYPLAIYGDGVQSTFLKFNGPSSGGMTFNVTAGSGVRRADVYMQGFSIEATTTFSNHALNIVATNAVGDLQGSTWISDINITTTSGVLGSPTSYWSSALRLEKLSAGHISNVTLLGDTSRISNIGLDLVSCLNFQITGMHITGYITAIRGTATSGALEGIRFNNIAIVSCTKGLDFTSCTELNFSHSHIDVDGANSGPVLWNNVVQGIFSNNLVYTGKINQFTILSITRAGSTATATTSTAHGYTTNDYVVVMGASQTEYNGVFQITVTSATTFTYTVTGTPDTPATGTIRTNPGHDAMRLSGVCYHNNISNNIFEGQSPYGNRSGLWLESGTVAQSVTDNNFYGIGNNNQCYIAYCISGTETNNWFINNEISSQPINMLYEATAGSNREWGTMRSGVPVTYSWTPTITFDTPGDLAINYSVQQGRYTKHEGKIIAHFRLVTSSFTHSTASGNLRISGLPYNADANAATSTYHGTVDFQGINAPTAGSTQINCFINTSGANYMFFVASGPGVSLAFVTTAAVPSGGSVALRGCIIYGY